MPAETVTKNGRTAPAPPAPPEDELREWARGHVARVRHLEKSVVYYLLGMLVLTPVWAAIQWSDNGAFERLSSQGNPGDWDPWILYVALVWGFLVVIDALKVLFDRPITEAEIDREVERLTSRL